ncbi:glucose-1-phosphate thymidylyltransferase RfbA [Maricaulaceae bacterium MS644]
MTLPVKRKAIVLAGGQGTRLYPMTAVVSKQLLPVYDKPLIYYPLSVLMLAQIRDICIISTPEQLPLFRKLLGSGEQIGVRFEYAEQAKPNGLAEALIIGEQFLQGGPSALILGDNILFGQQLLPMLRRADAATNGATIFTAGVRDPKQFGVVDIDDGGRPVALAEKPERPTSNLAVTGLYFYDNKAPALARGLAPSSRGELEITDLNRLYLEAGELRAEVMGRGMAWLDAGTPESLLKAAILMEVMDSRQGLKVACLEEIAWRNKWISSEDLLENAKSLRNNAYGSYLHSLVAPRG